MVFFTPPPVEGSPDGHTHSGTVKEKGEKEGTGTGHLRTTHTIRVTVSI